MEQLRKLNAYNSDSEDLSLLLFFKKKFFYMKQTQFIYISKPDKYGPNTAPILFSPPFWNK